MLEVRDLHSFYGEAHVLHGASLTVSPGEVVALLGRNGMGKSTLIRSVMRLAQPQVREGSLRWMGEELRPLTPHEVASRRIALVPQGRRLFSSLTVLEHLTMLKPASIKEGWTVDRAFEMFPRLAERKGHFGSQLSGGERQMLAIARALMIDPKLILMDEPSEGLAPVMVQHLETIIADLGKSGLGILLVEQNLYSALAVADRLYVLETGRVVHEASAESVRRDQSPLMRYLGVH
jgi:branched-chain amino acid transport system ATP-binding protein